MKMLHKQGRKNTLKRKWEQEEALKGQTQKTTYGQRPV